MFLSNKYSLKKLGDFTVSKGHEYPLMKNNNKKEE